jgi:S1-C subfamily serine protease
MATLEDVPGGARVGSIPPTGPARDGGLLVGDIVVAVNGDPLPAEKSAEELFRRVRASREGQVVTLDVLRRGASATVHVTPISMRWEGRESQIGARAGQ